MPFFHFNYSTNMCWTSYEPTVFFTWVMVTTNLWYNYLLILILFIYSKFQSSSTGGNHKVDVLKLNTTTIWTLTYERYVIKCGSKNHHQKDMCLNGIGLCARNIACHSWFNSQHDQGIPIWPPNKQEYLHFDNDLDTHKSSKLLHTRVLIC